MIGIYKQRDYRLQKVKVIESIFCRIRCEFSKFNTSQPAPSSSTFAQWNLQKIHMFPKDFHYFLFYQIAVLHQICYCLPGIYVPIRIHYSSTSEIFRTSFQQKLLIRSIRYFQNILLPEIVTSVHQIFLDILLPEIVTPVHQIFSEHLTPRNCYSRPTSILRYVTSFSKLLIPFNQS